MWCLLLQARNLVPKLGDNVCVLGHMILHIQHVPLNRSFNIFRSIRILKRVMCVLVVTGRWWYVCDHDGSAVTSEAVFQEAGQFGVTVGDVVCLVFWDVFVQHGDAVAECQQWLVDVRTLNHSDASVTRLRRSLRPSQINQGQLAYLQLSPDTCIFILVLTNDLQHSVRPRGRLIGSGTSLSPISVTVY